MDPPGRRGWTSPFFLPRLETWYNGTAQVGKRSFLRFLSQGDRSTADSRDQGLRAEQPMRLSSSSPKRWEGIRAWMDLFRKKPKIGLALGAGAARGVAHIGVLSVLKELDIHIDYLSGCSSGSFVGSLFAGGIEGEALELCGRQYRWRDAGRLNYLPKMGLATNARMASYLQKKIGNPTFEELRLPFFVVATNLTSGRRRVFNTGPVIPAVMASCALPGIFAPVEIDGELYCDGGLVDRIPSDVVRAAGADIVIAVELTALNHRSPPSSIYEVIRRALDIALNSQIEYSRNGSDLVIRPVVDDINEFEFHKNDLLIDRGKQAAVALLT